jgi:tRNA(Ile)-lysidine synthase
MVGHKKVKDFFIELKIPSETRALIPILFSQDTPVWVCGYRIDERYRITFKTKRVLIATINLSSPENSDGEEWGKGTGI